MGLFRAMFTDLSPTKARKDARLWREEQRAKIDTRQRELAKGDLVPLLAYIAALLEYRIKP